MVGLFKTLLPALLFATFAAAQSPPNAFNITQPSSTIWWGKFLLSFHPFNFGVFNSY